MTGDATAEPTALPGRGAAGTVWVELHGSLHRHAWLQADSRADAYSLFTARARASRWLTSDEAVGGLWAMNDAAVDGDPGSRVAWFQVELAQPVAGRPVPVSPLLSCATDTLTRLGRLDLTAVHVLLPAVRRPAPLTATEHLEALGDLVSSAGWFAAAAPGDRTPVHVTVAAPGAAAAAALSEWLSQVRQDVFHPSSVDEGPVEVPSLPAWADRPGSWGLHVAGTLAEWSPAALGWLVAFVYDALERHGVRGPLLLSARRAPA